MFISPQDNYRHYCYKITLIDCVYWCPGESDFAIQFHDGEYKRFYFDDSVDAEAMYNHVVAQLKGEV